VTVLVALEWALYKYIVVEKLFEEEKGKVEKFIAVERSKYRLECLYKQLDFWDWCLL